MSDAIGTDQWVTFSDGSRHQVTRGVRLCGRCGQPLDNGQNVSAVIRPGVLNWLLSRWLLVHTGCVERGEWRYSMWHGDDA